MNNLNLLSKKVFILPLLAVSSIIAFTIPASNHTNTQPVDFSSVFCPGLSQVDANDTLCPRSNHGEVDDFLLTPVQNTEPKVETYPWSNGSLRDRLKALESPPDIHREFFKSSFNKVPLGRDALNSISRVYGLPEDLLYYQWHEENRGTCEATSHKGASGCFQFLPATAEQFGLIQDGKDYRKNAYASADAAARYLLWLLFLMYDESADPSNWEQLRHALAAYNAGYKKVNVNGSPRIPSFTETQRYVYKIEELATGRATLVEEGESLDLLSQRTGIDVEALLRANPEVTNESVIAPGTFVQLPDPETGLSKVLITRGMTLSEIHRGTGASVEDLMQANDLSTSASLQVGQIIVIPPL